MTNKCHSYELSRTSTGQDLKTTKHVPKIAFNHRKIVAVQTMCWSMIYYTRAFSTVLAFCFIPGGNMFVVKLSDWKYFIQFQHEDHPFLGSDADSNFLILTNTNFPFFRFSVADCSMFVLWSECVAKICTVARCEREHKSFIVSIRINLGQKCCEFLRDFVWMLSFSIWICLRLAACRCVRQNKWKIYA